jgi:hypothetical protein
MRQQDGTGDSEEFDLPHVAPWVPRALTVYSCVALVLMAASWWNPWRLVLLDDHDLLLTAAGYFGLCAFTVALWMTLRRSLMRRLTLALLSVTLGVLSLLLVVVMMLSDSGRVTRIGAVDDGSIHTTHSSFLMSMSGCYQFEVRDESGWFSRHQAVGRCLDDEKERPTASTDGNRLTVTVGRLTCEYDVDAAALRIEPVDSTCDVLASPPGR